MVIGILGILKAGAAYVPLDPGHPQERLDYTVRDAQIRVMICDETTRLRFFDRDLSLNVLSVADETISSGDVSVPLQSIQVDADAAAYVIYTSGSTGQPKGCVITHRNVVRLFLNSESLFHFDEHDVWTLFHSFAFDFSVWEIWGALFYGGRLVVVPYSVSRSPDEFWNLLVDEQVTVLNQTPSAFRLLMVAESSQRATSRPMNLRYVIFGGEGLDPRLLRGWFLRHGAERPQLINMYGITETTVHVTYHRLTADDIERGGSPIGKPLPDLQIYLLDEQGQSVPPGVSGEIYVGGAGLARGYLNRPELTAARFVSPSFTECSSDRLYRSGDLARWNEDGTLDFLGRIDNQVKIRGHRIELGEIEAAIADYPGIAGSAVVVHDFSAEDQRLIGYFVSRDDQKFSQTGLEQHLRRQLPVYMIPSALIPLDRIPLTINGKLDRAALPIEKIARPKITTESIASSVQKRETREPVTSEQRQQLLAEWTLPTDQTSDLVVPTLFEKQVMTSPQAIAVIVNQQRCTYEELNKRANRLAHYLIQCGVGPESFVGICLDRSLDMIVALQATIKAGAAFLPLDPQHPTARLQQIIGDAQPLVILTTQTLANRLPSIETIQALDCDQIREQIERAADSNPTDTQRITPLRPGHPVYALFTSGSTGTPKGIVIEHAALISYFQAMQQKICFGPGWKHLAISTIGFDISILELFQTLCHGATVVLATDNQSHDPSELAKLISTGITSLQSTPSFWSILIENHSESLRNLIVITGGEALSKNLAARLKSVARQVWNCYGPTEATIYACVHEVEDLDLTDEAPLIVSIGRPLQNYRLIALSEQCEPSLNGTIGELYIAGTSLARGYLNRPDLTAERFVKDPFAAEPGRRMYRTGDLVRCAADGKFHFLERTDHQVKIRGLRIELGEIEANLLNHPAVAQAVVLARDDGHGGKGIVAYLVRHPRDQIDLTDLKPYLARILPHYMIPAAFVELPCLPLNPSGKLDKTALPAVTWDQRDLEIPYVPPRTPLEHLIASTWCNILKLERVSIDDNFFELGGHSLLAIRVVSNLRKQLQREIPVRWVFENPTIERFAQKLEERTNRTEKSTAIPLVNRQQPLPLSFGQHAMWLVQAMLPDQATYHQPIAFRIAGQFDRVLVDRALDQIIERHESLRTALIQCDDTMVQHISPPDQSLINRREIRWDPQAGDTEHQSLHALLLEEVRRPFDLAVAPLWRILWVELSNDDPILLLTFHHSIIDEWSMRIFSHELTELYSAMVSQRPADLPVLPIQYAGFASWQRSRQTSAEWEQSLVYWKEQLADLPTALELPTDQVRPLHPSGRGAIHEFRISGPITGQLRQLAQQESTTLFSLLLATFHVWLARHTGQTDIIVGTPLANRTRPEVQSLIGYFLNTLPIRARLDANPSFRQVLRQVHETFWDAYAHAEIPFEQLVELAVTEREFGRQPIYQVLFVLLEEGVENLKFGDATGLPFAIETETSKNDLTLDIQAIGEDWICRFEYATDLFSAQSMERMAEHFQVLLNGISTNPDTTINHLPLLTAREQQQIVIDWNQTAFRFPPTPSIHGLFEQQVELTPDVDAIVFRESRLSYRELNERANLLAMELIQLGVTPDSLVGLFIERSIELMVGLLGILKAGAAYVPLDPANPPARLQSVIHDAKFSLVVTEYPLANQLPHGDVRRVIVNSGSHEHPSATNPQVALEPFHRAYVLYTSGSTGQPKGVAMEHRALTNLIHWQIQQSTAGPQSKTLQFASIGFDVSFQELFATWCAGGTLVLIDEIQRRDMALLFKTIVSEQIERIFVPFVILQQFIEICDDFGTSGLSLREIVTAGEQLQITPQFVRFFEHHPDCKLVNQYGPTEAHVVASYTLDPFPQNWPTRPPIGRPIANLQLYVLDSLLQPLPIGVPGELHIGGIGVARGYLNQPAWTAEKFLKNPFSTESGSRLYRTGDKARWRDDGQLEFLGRIDQQIKYRGFRIELGEIESVLNQFPQVAQAVVILREDRAGEKSLVAYIVPANPGAVPTVSDLRTFLLKQLPEYMVPTTFVFLPNLPHTVNGKVNRKGLPILTEKGVTRNQATIPPRSPLENLLVNTWKSLFGIKRISVEDNFFDLGGHSLLAMRVVSNLRKLLLREIPVRWVFENPTIERFAQKLEERTNRTEKSTAIPLVNRQQPLPLSFGQHAMWLVQAMLPDQATYHQPIAFRIAGQFDRVLVDRALDQIIERHESLRTALIQSDDTLVQHISPPDQALVNRREIRLDLQAGDTENQTLHAVMLEEVRRPFDLAVAPLWRILWVELSNDDPILLLTFHHSIIDEWSMRLFSHELTELYSAMVLQRPADLPVLPIQYADFASWQRSRQTSAEWEQSLVYWKEQLADLPTALELPTDQVRPLHPSGRGAIHEFRISGPITGQLRQLAQQESTTLFSLLLATFHVWLARHTGQTDIIVGTPLANRTRPEVQSLIGYFLNTLPIRARLDANPSFRQVLRQVHETFWDAYAHAEIPFEQLVELAVTEREFGRQPIYQVMFVLLEEGVENLKLGDATGLPFSIVTETSKNDLTLDIQAIGEDWICRLEYATDLFSRSRIESMSCHFGELLLSITQTPDHSIGRLNLLSDSERAQFLVEANPIETSFSSGSSIHQRFEEQVRRTPNAIAISCEGKSLSYSELNSRANQLARQLTLNQIQIESLVGICLERSLEMVIGILGILKAGAAYVPLDPGYPQDRLDYMIQDSELQVLICDETTKPRFLNSKSPLTIVSACPDASNHLDSDFSSVVVTGDNAAYVIYTSGSTGQPKGCLITHANVVRLFETTESLFQFQSTDVWSLFHSFAFDFSVWEIWGPLLYGGRLVVVPYAVSRSPDEFLDLLIDEGVTVLNQTPSAFRHLIETAQSRMSPPDSLRLRFVIFGGEALDPRSLRDWVHQHGTDSPQLVNMYGITETTVHVTYQRLTADDMERGGSPIGLPLPDLQVYLLNPDGMPVPMGVPGEIYVGGAGLARGYLNRPELTAARFVPRPWDRDSSARLYRSGDLARWNSDGTLDFLGRIDKQVKIRGHRIELGEIEAAIQQQPGVAQVAVITRDDGPGGMALVAYVVPQSGTRLDVTKLRANLAQQLPSYMIPAHFVELEILPLTINGKLDTKRLPAPQLALQHREKSLILPRNPAEERICSIWCNILKLERVSIDDNFFELGGHSLLAIRVVSNLRKQLQREIPVRWVFENPTIERFAQKLEERTNRTEKSTAIPLVNRQQPLPLSFGQHAMWLVQAMLPDQATYHQPIAFRISRQVNRVIVDRALDQIIARHESLRTALIQSDDTLVQHISPPDQALVNRREIRLDLQPGDTENQTLHALILEEVRRPFDLAVAPLWRVLWVELSNDDPILLLTFHHSIIDEWSMRIFSHELTELYSAMVSQRPADLPVLPIQYAGFASWQRSRQTSAEWEQSLVYWKEQLADLPTALELPTDQVRPLHPSGRGAIHEFRISGPITGQLRQLAQQESTTLFSLLLATFHVWLARHTGQTDIIVGTPLANRTRPEVQSLIGYFLNTLPIRARLDANPSFRQVLRQVHETFWDAYAHAEIPFEQLVELAVTEREFGRQPIYQVLFVLLEEGVENLKFGDATGLPFAIETETSKNDLTLDIQAIGEDWICRFEYATDLFSAQSMERMAEHFQVLLNGISTNPDTTINRLPLLTASEQQQLLAEWTLPTDHTSDLVVPTLFEKQVMTSPQAIAVIVNQQRCTYEELNKRANRLAHYLIQCGVGPESFVGICLDRSLDMIVALQATIKAGAAFLPLDPQHPTARLQQIIGDAQPLVILTTQTLANRLPSIETIQALDCDQIREQIERAADSNPTDTQRITPLRPGHPVYALFTSGSTGTPKGIVIEHAALISYFQAMQQKICFGPGWKHLAISTIGFDISILELFQTLCHGATVVLATDNQSHDPSELAKLISTGITSLQSTPSFWSILIENHSESLRNLIVITGGEALSKNLAARLKSVARQVWNCYGPTEATIWASVHEVEDLDLTDEAPLIVSIGRPLQNYRLIVLSEQCEPSLNGAIGELYITGTSLARGYLNRPDLTAERFVKDPFAAEPGRRMYRTGDLVRCAADGKFHFLERTDHQVKIRGLRIELGEIEANLLNHPAVAQAVVLARDDGHGGKGIVAYLVRHPRDQIDLTDLKPYLARILPHYMIPAAFVELPCLPLNPSGKLDKTALPAVTWDQRDLEIPYVPPRTPLEHLIASTWCNILKLERVSIDDNFFELGGHSLLAIRVVDAIKRSSSKTIKVADLFRYATVAELARLLSDPLQADDNASFGTYLESIRPGQHPVNLVIVGAKLRVPLETLSANIPVWWLKLDGLHIWPPQFLDIPTQAAAQVQELLFAIPTGTILLCGHSYGGLLAIEIANQIRKLAHRSVELVLLEPSMPSNCRKSKVEQLAQKLNELRHPGRLNHFRTLVRGAYKSIQHKLHRRKINKLEFDKSSISADDRWRYMSPFLMQHIRVFQMTEPLDEEIHLIKTSDYDEATVEELSRMTTSPLQIHTVAEHLDHLDIAKPQQSAAWMSVIEQLIDRHPTASPT